MPLPRVHAISKKNQNFDSTTCKITDDAHHIGEFGSHSIDGQSMSGDSSSHSDDLHHHRDNTDHSVASSADMPAHITSDCVSSTPIAAQEPTEHKARHKLANQQHIRKDLTLQFESSLASNASTSGRPRHDSTSKSKQSWLLRLFESKLFDMSLAITYLFNSKEQGVQVYIGKKADF